MKKVLFATTATAALALGGMASAQGISLFGDARLGLGYGINNDGSVNFDDDGDPSNDLRAISRVRFGVNMTGETNSGITFGATIRADNAKGGQGSDTGQTDGNVFVSGAFGTLTFGDTNGADEQWVGDLVGNYSITGLGDLNETAYISNGGSFGADDGNGFLANPDDRPTIRYDFEIAGFGLSLSSNKTLDNVGVGAGYSGEFASGTFNVGLGYYDFTEFTITGEASTAETTITDANGDEVVVLVPVAAVGATIPGGKQYSAVIGGTFGDYGANVIWNDIDGDGDNIQTLGIGATAGFGDFDIGAFYRNIIKGDGQFDNWDGADAYGLTASYDLGGGAQVAGGVVRTYDTEQTTDDVTIGTQAATIADFGIKMSF